ncbi:MAG: SH3 domain-containing protein [Lachnospiraceae bacterium]|nr:SH3 domain-containing protein [Lachnospiraceae bacterium]
MKKCPVCGTECGNQDVFCSECGASLQNVIPQENNVGQQDMTIQGFGPVPGNYSGRDKASGRGKASSSGGKKSNKAAIIAVSVAAVAVIAVLVAGIFILKGKEKGASDEPVIGTDQDASGKNGSDGTSDTVVRITPAEVEKLPTVAPETDNNDTAAEPLNPQTPETAPVQTPAPYIPEENDSYEGNTSGIGTAMQTCQVVNCSESITLRTQASVTASEICQIPLGAEVTFISTAGNGFYQIIYNGNTGYSLASFLSINPYDTTNATYMQVVNCTESITLRKTPNTKADEFCQIPLGATVQYLDTAENGFYMVSYNGQIGYALASYLKIC